MLKHAILALSLGVAAFVTRELRLSAFDVHLKSQRYEDIYYLPPARWLPVLSAGFQDALADLLWCRSLVYFGEEMGQRGQVRHVFDYSDAIITLDPSFRAAYRWAAIASVYRPQKATVEDGLRGAQYLERALQLWPNDGELHWDYGSLMRFEVAPLLRAGPEKDKVLALAAPHLSAAASLGAGPPWLALNSAALLSRLGKNEQAIRHLEEVYGTINDEKTKARIEAQLAELRSKTFLEAFKAANQSFEKSRVERYPYLSPSLFLILGPANQQTWHQYLAQRFLPTTQDNLVDELPGDDELSSSSRAESTAP